MTIEQQKRLRTLVAAMRKRATAEGPYHPDWDNIFDIELLLGGRPTEQVKPVEEWILLAEQALGLAPGESPR